MDNQARVRSTTQPFHYPTTSSIARSDFFGSFLFPSTADVGLIVACDQFLVDRSGVVGRIQTEVLQLLWGWRRRG